jgi:DNA-binding Lrp family transcriptional regulator
VREDEWRVEIDLDDEAHGFGLGERFRAHDLDDEARKRLGERIVVTRDGPRVFLYAGDEAGAHQAELVARELVAADDLSADISVTRWHPLEEEWLDASIPLPRSEEEQQEELERREEIDRVTGDYDWLVKVDMPSRSEAEKLEEQLRDEGQSVHRRWRYVTVDVATEEHANELAARLQDLAPADAEVSVEANPDDIPTPVFVLLESRL